MNKQRYKKFVILQVCGLILLLCGQWPLAMVLFVVGHILSVRPQEQQVIVKEVSRPVPEVEDIEKESDEPEEWYESKYNPSGVAVKEKTQKVKKSKKKADPAKGLKVESRTFKEDDGSYCIRRPNGFVVRGEDGVPLLCDYNRRGKATDNGCKVSPDGWLKGLYSADGMSNSTVVLVHAVKGRDNHLLKVLQVNDIERKGKSLSVEEMAQDEILLDVANSLRESYVNDMMLNR